MPDSTSVTVDSTTKTASTPKRRWWVHLLVMLMVIVAYSCRAITIETKVLQAQELSSGESKHKLVDDGLRFCRQPMVHYNNVTLQLLYQCRGQAYEDFAQKLHALAQNHSQSFTTITNASNLLTSTDSQWGHRPFPLPNNKTILVLGNSHLRQISKTIICQYSDRIDWIHPFSTGDIFAVTFSNGATWMSITNTVLVYSHDWLNLLEEEYIQPFLQRSFSSLDAILFGKFTIFADAQHTNFETTMNHDQREYQVTHGQDNASMTIDFATIPPPRLVDLVQETEAMASQTTTITTTSSADIPILSIPMFSQSDQVRAQHEQQEVEALLDSGSLANNNTSRVYFLNTRQFIDQMGLECGSDDKYTVGTCHEPDYNIIVTNHSEDEKDHDLQIMPPRSPADMHRCAGTLGGHADLVAWNVIEALYKEIFHQ